MCSCRLLIIWTEGKGDYPKWPKKYTEKFNISLKRLNLQKPKEIHRAVRGVDSLKFWKGTEFRSFMLYYGIVVLKELLPSEVYSHFLLLSCAVRICYSNAYSSYRPISKVSFDKYIEEYINIYGIHSIGSNIHNLSHIFDDVEQFGSLIDISTYPFENRLQFLKSRLKQPKLPLQQITRRLAELSLDYDLLYTRCSSEQSNFPKLRWPYKKDNTTVYKEIVDISHTISTLKKGSWFLTVNNDIVSMQYAVKVGNEILIYGFPVKEKKNFFVQPCSSERLHIFEITEEMDPIRSFEYGTVKAKMICLTSN